MPDKAIRVESWLGPIWAYRVDGKTFPGIVEVVQYLHEQCGFSGHDALVYCRLLKEEAKA